MSLHLRPARVLDAGAMGDILYGFQAELYGGPTLWSGAETIADCGAMIERGWVTVAEMAGGRVAGFLACDGMEVCALYVTAEARNAGVGQSLLEVAKQGCDRLRLKVLEQNAGARRFYRRNGFIEVGRSDGADNDEGLPDITMEWRREGAR
ncbi:GNAT family N-acetyltransferase [Aquicoccus sp. SU-CL01552]|uniref:GNAT family N-acetyltransferase n=1 Tax=Aquicoccus sp. SU-CL01552 TaxID=3127656 RepID=UPI003103C239